MKQTDNKFYSTTLFGNLERGETYWYKYRLYKTVDGEDYFSNWSDMMGDVYTGYEGFD